MQAPESIVKFFPAGKKLLQEQKIGEFHFSRGTYQIEVLEGDSYWPFLQFDEKGTYLDAFCTCKESEEKNGCPHLAAAFLKIYAGHALPIHQRFQSSFWFYLFEQTARKTSYEVKNLSFKEGKYLAFTPEKSEAFWIQAKTKEATQKLKAIFLERKKETEETSLKFSNLPREELASYRSGRASLSLRYELSFWSDLAKYFMLLQEEKKPYTIEFQVEGENIPEQLRVFFEEIEAYFALKDLCSPSLIESLKTVESNLPIFESKWDLKEIIFDPKEACFRFRQKSQEKTNLEEGIEIGDWVYLPEQGFYRKVIHPLLKKEIIPSKEIAESLSTYTSFFKNHLKDPIHSNLKKVQYHLYFDEKEQFHVEAYLLEKGDLLREDTHLFFPWVYLKEKGFFHLAEPEFSAIRTVVPKEEVAEFVAKHRVFLHSYPCFKVHFQVLETFITYSVEEDLSLCFQSSLGISHKDKIRDFGRWIYVENTGFFQKEGKQGAFALLEEKKIPKEEVGSFIEENKEELLFVPHFFSAHSPVQRVGLKAFLNEEEKIEVHPEISYETGYSSKNVHLLGGYTYVRGEGFFDTSSKGKLPKEYIQPKVISAKEESLFLQYETERLKPLFISLEKKLQKPKFLHLQIKELFLEKKKKRTFLIVDIEVQSDLGATSLRDIWETIHQKKAYLFSEAGALLVKQTRFNWLKALGKIRLHRKYKRLKLTLIEWIRLSIFENLSPPLEDTPEAKKTREVLLQLNEVDSKRLLDISKLGSVLRPYQEIGLQWLWYLYCYGLAGILCDDMGLGKTHQAMALLAASSQEDASYKYLVVCPTSVIYHWQNLLQRYLPSLKVLVYHGISRSLKGFPSEYDVLVTSYGILRTGKENFKGYRFEIAILDELQFAKNIRSQTHKNLRSIEANMKLGLTGTPIENRIKELKALFDIILPNYLPTGTLFRELFEIPIEKHRDQEKRKLLSELVKPFLLRRKKEEVLLDLPAKIEQLVYCDLSAEQKELYQKLIEEKRGHIIELLQKEEPKVPVVPIFSLLSQIKQLCDHPSVLLKDASDFEKHESGKWEVFMELMEEALDSERKVVIFSQYLEMIEIFKRYFRKKRIGYAVLTGSTKDRKGEIQKFHQDPKCKVFLASLLAAGVGIDLSCASIVIHYDRWWNAAKEDQATDRVHRIGQSRGVQVFKMITKDTIEERIHELITQKKTLLEETIGKDEMDQIKMLSKEELLKVFQKIS